MRPKQIVVLYSDRDGLIVAESRGGKVAIATGVVGMQATRLVKP